ncbi:MAG: dephospho-CoA kinase [Sandaracinaceae bacterium]|nr:dephospho-CoA kinase [Sandaracinaceae bacterium]
MIGLTGGIGSGKSTVAKLFAELGVPIVDADKVARDVVAPGTEGLREVAAAFGEDVLAPDGSLDRAKLGERVFADEAARRRLNAILHPRIAQESMRMLFELGREGHAYAIYEAALLVENGAHRTMGGLVVVAADEATQIARIRARDGLDEAAARARIAAQLPLAEKIAAATWVIHNDGTLEHAREQVRETHRAILARIEG